MPVNEPLVHQFRQQSRMFRVAIDDVKPQQWSERPLPKLNPLCFLATHVTEVRFYVAKYAGLEASNPFSEEVQKARSADDVSDWPSPTELLVAWTAVDESLAVCIGDLDPSWMAEAMQTKIPWGVRTRGDMMAFFAHHEAYHLGQLGSVRSALGLPSLMSRLAAG